MNSVRANSRSEWWLVALLVLFFPPLFVFVVVVLLLVLVGSLCLHITIWTWWCLRGRDILVLYSDSPLWHDYIEEQILPRAVDRAVILNWSQRKRWRVSVARLAFYHFGGYREFNPLAVVFRPFRRSRIFRFWRPFKDSSHGHPEALHRMEEEFFGSIGVLRPERPAP
jgi:hypothetical protein